MTGDANAGTYTASASSGSITPTEPGRYCLRAEYQGSALYNGSSDYDVSECFTVVVVGLGSPVTAWIGLKNSDDQGTQYDLKAELFNGDLRATEIMKLKEVVEELEAAADAFEKVANTVESIAVKES